MSMSKILVYTEFNGSLVFATLEVAERISRISFALEAQTWRELEERMPPGELARVQEKYLRLHGEFFEIPEKETKNPRDFLPGLDEGDYPPWLQPEQAQFIPAELLIMYGRQASGFTSGPFWILDPRNESALVSALWGLGFHVTRRDDLEFH